MYFSSRAEAGRELASKLVQYSAKNCAVIALSAGGVLVGAQIAMRLHADLMMLFSGDIVIPGESSALAGVTSNNVFKYNSKLSSGQIDEMRSEYMGYIEAQRIQKLNALHRLMSKGGEIDRDMLRRRVIILVSDGLNDSFELDLAAEFLKPVKVEKLIIATPIASMNALDHMRLLGDEVQCLSTLGNYIETNHYYDNNIIPNMEGLLKIMRTISLNWDMAARS